MGEFLSKPNLIYNGGFELWDSIYLATGFENAFEPVGYNIIRDGTTKIEGDYSYKLDSYKVNSLGQYSATVMQSTPMKFTLDETKNYRFHIRYKIEWVSAAHGIRIQLLATEDGWSRTLGEDGTFTAGNQIIKSPGTTDWYELSVDIDTPYGVSGPLDDNSIYLVVSTWYSEFATTTEKKFFAWIDDVWLYEVVVDDDYPDGVGYILNGNDWLGLQDNGRAYLGENIIWADDSISIFDRSFTFVNDGPPPE